MQQEPFVIERTYNAPIEKVWKAITDKDQMKQWYFDVAAFKPEVGFEFQFDGGSEEKTYRHLCKVTEVIPGKKLKYSWRYEGYEGNSFVTFELFAEGNKTRLKLTHEGLETFPSNMPDFAKQSFAAGWTEITSTLLREFVETTTIKKSVEINADTMKVWHVLVHPDYTKQWAAEFYEGTFVETDWQKGSPVLWKAGDEIGAKGIVEESNNGSLLKIAYYDDLNDTELGDYREIYSLCATDGKTTLSIDSGPLSIMHSKKHEPFWDKAIHKMKVLAEK